MKNSILILAVLILSFNSNSQSWTKVESNTKLRFNSISFGSELVGYIGADDGTLLKTIDGGRNWSVILNDTSLMVSIKDIVDVDFQSATHGYIVRNNSQNAVSSNGRVIFTRDGGVTWNPASISMCGPLGVHMTDTANGYIFGASCFGGFTIDKVTQRSFVSSTYKTWSNSFLRGLDFYSPSYGITAGDIGNVFRTIDSGVVWDTLSSGFFQTINNIKFLNDSVIFAAVDSLRTSIFFSTDSGNTWAVHTNSSTFTNPLFNSLAVSKGKMVFAVGTNVGIVPSPLVIWGRENGTWNNFTANHANVGFNSIEMSDSTRAFAVGDSGLIYTNIDFTTSIKEITKSYKLQVYPNPASSFIQIDSEELKTIALFSLNGKKVLEHLPQSAESARINIPALPSGIYLLKVTHQDNSVQYHKIGVH